MILYCNYEELQALRAGARVCLEQDLSSSSSAVLAPSETRARVEEMLPRLTGDVSLSSLEELRRFQTAVAAIVECLRVEMESAVLATHAADEVAVSAYFDFAHGLTVAHRLREMAAEMEDVIELVTGEAPSPSTARAFKFPD